MKQRHSAEQIVGIWRQADLALRREGSRGHLYRARPRDQGQRRSTVEVGTFAAPTFPGYISRGVDAAFGLGTAPPGGLFSPVSDADAEATIERAWSLGVRFFDSAPLYGFGLAERRLGSFLRRQKRDSFAISTKRSLLANVNPAFAWVRLAQRIPVRIALDRIPDDILVVAGRSSS